MKLNWNFGKVAGGRGALGVQTKTPSAVISSLL